MGDFTKVVERTHVFTNVQLYRNKVILASKESQVLLGLRDPLEFLGLRENQATTCLDQTGLLEGVAGTEFLGPMGVQELRAGKGQKDFQEKAEISLAPWGPKAKEDGQGFQDYQEWMEQGEPME